MEWVEGMPLYEWGRAQERTSAEVLRVLEQLAQALDVAHAAGGLHRDVKGDNVLITSQGRAVLLDWGCATYEGAKELTDTALPPGTTSYRSPEAHRWGWAHRKTAEPYVAGPKDDVYALGVTAYRLCTGIYPPVPDEGSGPQRRLMAPRELATVSQGLNRLILSCLSQEASHRPSSPGLAVALGAAAEEPGALAPIRSVSAAANAEEPSRAGPHSRFPLPAWVAAAGAVVATLALLAWSAAGLRYRSEPESGAWQTARMRQAPSPEVPDGGVADEALASVEDLSKASLPVLRSFGRPMPKVPLPGQRRPPCERGEVVIRDACWVKVADETPPCGETMFDYEGCCYKVSVEMPRQPTSDQP